MIGWAIAKDVSSETGVGPGAKRRYLFMESSKNRAGLYAEDLEIVKDCIRKRLSF
jgi:hypothetical protein